MSIIGGYFLFHGAKVDAGELRRKVQAFQIPSVGDSQNNEAILYEYEYGHLFIQQRNNVRSLITVASGGEGNLFLSLGYLTLQDWSDWDVDQGCLRISRYEPGGLVEDIKRAEGEFVAIYKQRNSDELHIINDRFAARPFYYLQTPDKLLFCSNLFLLLQLAGSPIRLDPLGLIQIFLFSHTIGTQTHLQSVCRLTPASHLMVSKQAIRHTQYWKLRYDVRDDLNPEEFARDVFSAFRDGVGKRVHLMKKGFLALSGGLDSRLIAGCLPENAAFSAVTFLPERTEQNPEYQIAHQVAEILRIPHYPSPLAPGVVSHYSKDLIMLIGGGFPIHHSGKAIQAPYKEYDMFFGGGPGDVLVGSYIPNLYYTLPSRTESIIRTHTHIWQSDILTKFFPKDMVMSCVPELERVLRETFERVAGPTAAHTLSAWKMVYRQPAFTFCHLSHSHPLSTQVHPHLAYAYNDLILQLPALWLYQRHFYKYMIYQCLPQLRLVPYANTGEILVGEIGSTSLPLWYYKWWAARRRFNAAIKRLMPSPRPNTSFELYLIQNDKQLFKDMREILTGFDDLKNYFHVSEWMKYLDDVENGKVSAPLLRQPEEAVGFLAAILYLCRYYG